MARFIYEREGFTLVEVLVALAIATIVIAGSVAFYLMAHTAWIDCSKRAPLQRRASLAMEKMVRGINGRYGIREGKAGTLNKVANDHLEVTVDMNDPPTPLDSSDDTTISFYKSGDQLIYDPNTDPLVTGDEFDIVEKVSSLEFNPSDPVGLLTTDIVTINLDMHDKVRDTDINVNLSTKVWIRN